MICQVKSCARLSWLYEDILISAKTNDYHPIVVEGAVRLFLSLHRRLCELYLS